MVRCWVGLRRDGGGAIVGGSMATVTPPCYVLLAEVPPGLPPFRSTWTRSESTRNKLPLSSRSAQSWSQSCAPSAVRKLVSLYGMCRLSAVIKVKGMVAAKGTSFTKL